MLTFDRPNFRVGKTVIKETTTEKLKYRVKQKGKKAAIVEREVPKVLTYRFSIQDIGKQFEFLDEKDVLARYPLCFRESEQWQAFQASREELRAKYLREQEEQQAGQDDEEHEVLVDPSTPVG